MSSRSGRVALRPADIQARQTTVIEHAIHQRFRDAQPGNGTADYQMPKASICGTINAAPPIRA
jgi:hypothetical protein